MITHQQIVRIAVASYMALLGTQSLRAAESQPEHDPDAKTSASSQAEHYGGPIHSPASLPPLSGKPAGSNGIAERGTSTLIKRADAQSLSAAESQSGEDPERKTSVASEEIYQRHGRQSMKQFELSPEELAEFNSMTQRSKNIFIKLTDANSENQPLLDLIGSFLGNVIWSNRSLPKWAPEVSAEYAKIYVADDGTLFSHEPTVRDDNDVLTRYTQPASPPFPASHPAYFAAHSANNDSWVYVNQRLLGETRYAFNERQIAIEFFKRDPSFHAYLEAPCTGVLMVPTTISSDSRVVVTSLTPMATTDNIRPCVCIWRPFEPAQDGRVLPFIIDPQGPPHKLISTASDGSLVATMEGKDMQALQGAWLKNRAAYGKEAFRAISIWDTVTGKLVSTLPYQRPLFPNKRCCFFSTSTAGKQRFIAPTSCPDDSYSIMAYDVGDASGTPPSMPTVLYRGKKTADLEHVTSSPNGRYLLLGKRDASSLLDLSHSGNDSIAQVIQSYKFVAKRRCAARAQEASSRIDLTHSADDHSTPQVVRDYQFATKYKNCLLAKWFFPPQLGGGPFFPPRAAARATLPATDDELMRRWRAWQASQHNKQN